MNNETPDIDADDLEATSGTLIASKAVERRINQPQQGEMQLSLIPFS